MSNFYRGSSKDASYQVSIHLAKRFQKRRYFQKLTNQKQELPVAAMFVNGSGRNEQSLQRTCHRCFLPSFGSFGQAVSEEKIFKNQPIRIMNCLWWPCLLMDRDKMSIFQRGPSIVSGVSLEAGNRRKSPVTLAVTAGYFFSVKKIMRENLISLSAIQRTVRVSTDQHVYVCRSLQINIVTYPLT